MTTDQKTIEHEPVNDFMRALVRAVAERNEDRPWVAGAFTSWVLTGEDQLWESHVEPFLAHVQETFGKEVSAP